MSGPLTPKDREILVAKRRIEYKYARPYIEELPDTDRELLEEVERIIEDELDQQEIQHLEHDKKLEFMMIKSYYGDED